MELRHLQAFVAVAEEQSITRAAARLFVAQPAVSRRLMELERHVGVRLLVRHARGTRLTDAGRLLLPEARDILTRAARMGAPTAGAEETATARTGQLSTDPGPADGSAAEAC